MLSSENLWNGNSWIGHNVEYLHNAKKTLHFHRYVKICIFRTVSVSNGRRLTGLRELRIEYENKVLYTCSPTGSTVGAARRWLAAKWTSRRRWINLPCQQKKKGCQISVNKRNQALAERIERIGNDLWLMDGAISFMTCSYVIALDSTTLCLWWSLVNYEWSSWWYWMTSDKGRYGGGSDAGSRYLF